mgnify:CR=1 FL=1
MRRRVRHASRATRPSQPREQISTLDGFARSEETRGGDTPKRPADPLDPRTSRLVSNRADTVLGSRLKDDAIWPTPSTPAKVRRDPLSAATFSAPPAASALKTTTTRAVRAVAHFLFCDDFRRAFVFSRRRSNPTPSDRTRVHVSFRLNHADPIKQDALPTAGAGTSAASSVETRVSGGDDAAAAAAAVSGAGFEAYSPGFNPATAKGNRARVSASTARARAGRTARTRAPTRG